MNEFETETCLLLLINMLGVLGVAADFIRRQNTRRKRGLPRLRPRRLGVHPLNRVRDIAGRHNHLYVHLREHPEIFFSYTRMSVQQFDFLLNIVRPRLEKTSHCEPISPAMRLIITLRYLADGESCSALATSYRCGKSTAHKIIDETTGVLWDMLRHTYLEPPSKDDYVRIASEFYEKWDMPHCVGSIDGKHIKILSGTTDRNHKQVFSIVLLAVCDANYNFTRVTIGAEESASHGGIMRDCKFGQALYEGRLPFPEDAPLPNTPADSMKFPFYLVGDEAFALKNNLMRPYSKRNNLNIKQQIFNYRLSRARRTIENCFWILANRWRIFHTTIFAQPEEAKNIVKACVVLHNFIQKTTEYSSAADREQLVEPENFNAGRIEDLFMRANRNAKAESFRIRDGLAEYFVSPEGARMWQYDIVNRGNCE